MAADKYPSIFSRQVEAIVYIYPPQMEVFFYFEPCSTNMVRLRVIFGAFFIFILINFFFISRLLDIR